MLQKWLFSGELYDPFSEFFVHLDPELAHIQYIQPAVGQLNGLSGLDGGFSNADNEDASVEYQGGLRLWETKYVFRKEMLPAFVGEEFGRKVNYQFELAKYVADGSPADIFHWKKSELHPLQLS